MREFNCKKASICYCKFLSVGSRENEPNSLADGLNARVSITKLINRLLKYANITRLSQLNGN